jgi:mannose-6-phosphate isomerase-like protein (cupin superfamily)
MMEKVRPEIIRMGSDPTRIGGAGRLVWELVNEKSPHREVFIAYTVIPVGESEGSHARESDEYLFYVSGNPVVRLENGEELHPAAHDLLHIPAGVRHSHENPGPDSVVQLFIRAHLKHDQPGR